MSIRIALLIKMTELSERIRHGKKKHGSKDDIKHRVHSDSEQTANDRHHGANDKLSFTAKRTISILLDEESINQRSISKRLRVSAQTVSEMVKTLEAKEIIVKSQGELNNENIIALTEKGKEIAFEVNKRIADEADRIFAGLSAEEIEFFDKILTKISESNLSDTE